MTGSVWANVYIGGGGTSSNDGGRTKVSTALEDFLEAHNDTDEAIDEEKGAKRMLDVCRHYERTNSTAPRASNYVEVWA